MWRAIGWLCGFVSISCRAIPDVGVIQVAYEREASSGSKLHDSGLQVLQTKCHDEGESKFLCEVTFISKGDSTQRLYFDIVAVARVGDRWELQSGLCKR